MFVNMRCKTNCVILEHTFEDFKELQETVPIIKSKVLKYTNYLLKKESKLPLDYIQNVPLMMIDKRIPY